MQAYASIHGHPQADIQAAFGEFGLLYGDARASIPYMTGGKAGAEQQADERMRFVQAFQEMRGQKRAEAESAPPKAPGLKPVSLGRPKDKTGKNGNH